MARQRRRLAFRILFGVSFTAFVSALLLEGGFRYVLFVSKGIPTKTVHKLSQPGLYADSHSEDAYWKLRSIWRPERKREATDKNRLFHPVLGWRSPKVDPSTYRHADEATLGERRPVLLYGDSFAECTIPAEDCFQGIHEESDLAGECGFLNYGVGGYGMDQAYLSLIHSIDLYADRNPVVIFGILLEDDLDRCALSFRSWPKPRLEITDNGLENTAPLVDGNMEYLEQYPPDVRSYAWRYLLYGSKLLSPARASVWRGERTYTQRKKSICRAMIESVKTEMEARGLQYFFVIFRGVDSQTHGKPWKWHEGFLEETFAELDIPFVDVQADLDATAAELKRPVEELYQYGKGRLGKGHYTREGNEAAYRTMMRRVRDVL